MVFENFIKNEIVKDVNVMEANYEINQFTIIIIIKAKIINRIIKTDY